jgi:hypothetical protein
LLKLGHLSPRHDRGCAGVDRFIEAARLSAPKRIGCPYRLAAFTAAPGFDAASWLPGDVMARFFHAG